jgi:hypothetical protein
MTRIMALLFLLLTLAIPATLLTSIGPSPWFILGTVGLIMLEIIVFCVLIHRAGA